VTVYLGALLSGHVGEAGKPAEQQQMFLAVKTRQLFERLSIQFCGRPQRGAVLQFFIE
jgi:hypothetical protein